MKLKVKKLTETALLPTQGSASAAGFDLYADASEIIAPGTTEKIRTGIAIEIPEGYFGAIYARSGLATKKGLRPANCVGVIDSDYRGEVIVALYNDSNSIARVQAEERIAQIVIQPYPEIEIEEVEELSVTDRGSGGFGSTGK